MECANASHPTAQGFIGICISFIVGSDLHLGIFIADEPRIIVVNIVQMTYLTQYLDSTDSTCMAVLSSAGNVAYQCACRDHCQCDRLQPVCFPPLQDRNHISLMSGI
jgi:hypothetical protein